MRLYSLKPNDLMRCALLSTFLIVMSGCQTTPTPTGNTAPADLTQFKEELRAENEVFQKELETKLARTIRNEIIPELREISTYSNNILRKQKKIKSKVFKKTVIGRVEWISTVNPEINFRARVDTGAQTCSIHAENIKEIERDGKQYVEFTTTGDDGVRQTFLKEVIKMTLVKSTTGKSEKRFVIRLDFIFGGQKVTANVNLNDREHLRHNFLIGRNLLLGNYIVDVSQSRLLGK